MGNTSRVALYQLVYQVTDGCRRPCNARTNHDIRNVINKTLAELGTIST